MTDYQLSEDVVDTITIDKGRPHIALVDPSTNTVYLCYHSSNLILSVDVKKKTVIARIKIENPDDMVLNQNHNRLYVIAKGKIAVIDTISNRLLGRIIPENANFARRLAINEKKNLLYLSYHNRNIVEIYDCATNTKISELSEGLNEPAGIAVDQKGDRVYIANSDENSIVEFDSSSHAYLDKFAIERQKDGIAATFYQRLDEKMFMNSNKKLLYVVGSIAAAAGGGGGVRFYLFVIDLESINESNNKIYISYGNSILALSECGEQTVRKIELVKTSFWKRIFAQGGPITYDPISNLIYRADGDLGILHAVSG